MNIAGGGNKKREEDKTVADLWKRLDGGKNKGCLESNTIFFCFEFRDSVKERNINVGTQGYAENHEMEVKEAISFIPKPGGTENRKAFKQRKLNKLVRL